jgi:hypothetical protein
MTQMSSSTLLPGTVEPDRAADRAAIVELVGAYGLFLDRNEFEVFAELFTEDARYDIDPDPKLIPLPLEGRDAIVAAMRATRERTGSAAFPRHVASNIVIRQLEADTAATESFLIVVFTYPDGTQELRRTGTCFDEFRKEGGRWRFARRLMTMDTAAGPGPVVPLDGEAG